jgi:hypothetical protein
MLISTRPKNSGGISAPNTAETLINAITGICDTLLDSRYAPG